MPATAIDAVFYYVEDDRVLRPDRLYDEAAIRRAWATVATRAGGGARVSAADSDGAAASPVPDSVRAAVTGP